MAKECSFDIVSQLDLQEVDNGVNHAMREISVRYDLKNSKSNVEFDKKEKEIRISAPDDFKLKSVIDVLQSKLVKRGISLKAIKYGKVTSALGGTVSVNAELINGMSSEKCREIAKVIREEYPKCKVQVEGEKVKVASKSRDVLQQVIALLKEKDFDIPIQFINYR